MCLVERALLSSPLANHNENKQRNAEPIRAGRKTSNRRDWRENMQPLLNARKRVTDVKLVTGD